MKTFSVLHFSRLSNEAHYEFMTEANQLFARARGEGRGERDEGLGVRGEGIEVGEQEMRRHDYVSKYQALISIDFQK